MKFNRLLLVAVLASMSSMQAHELETGNPKITCEIDRLDHDEREALLFSTEAAKECNFNMDFQPMSALADYNWLRNISQHLQAYKVVVTNNSSEDITLYKNEYISSLIGSIVDFKTVADERYPDFKKKAKALGIGSAFFGGLTLLGGAGAAYGASNSDLKSEAKNVLMGVGAATALAMGSLAYLLWSKRSKVKALEAKRLALRKTCPTIKTPGHKRIKLDDDEAFTLAPGAEFKDTILIDTHAMQTTMALLGNTRAELAYGVGDE